MRVRVFIVTTEGPVQVQSIVPEDPDIPPVICLNGTTRSLPISPDYARFVRRGTGVVAKLTGHDSYRVDVDAPIDGGQSWQLGLLLAHLLADEGRLAGPNDAADLAVFATGEVDRALDIRPVGHIDLKRDRAAAAVESQKRALFLVPQSEATGSEGITGVSTVEEALRIIGSGLPAPPVGAHAAPVSSGRRFPRFLAAAGLIGIVLVGLGTWKFVSGSGDDGDGASGGGNEIPAARLDIDVLEVRAPDGFTCASLRFAGLETITKIIVPEPSGVFVSKDRPSLCSVGYRIGNPSDHSLRATLQFEGPAPSANVDRLVPPGETELVTWDPQRQGRVDDVRFSVAGSGTGRADWHRFVQHRIELAAP